MPLRAKILEQQFASSGQRRSLASSTSSTSRLPTPLPSDEPDDVLFSTLYGVRTIELNRPKKLNSLNASMIRKIIPRLREWEKSDMANIMLMSGAGTRAFCAGGDVAALAKQNATKEGQIESSDYFALEYQLDHLIATYSKPYIAIMDGITMGGGVGLSVHAPFRIATERTVYAMPETTIGFFPDVGGGFCLSRLDGEIGTYLALTSERLMGVQAFYAGIATHYLDSSALTALTTRLSELVFRDYASLDDRLDLINSTIAEFCTELPSPDSYEASKYGNLAGEVRMAIDRCFSFNTVEEILEALQKESESSGHASMPEWARATLKTIKSRSPTSLRVTLRQLRIGREWTIDQTFKMEHVMASKFMARPDFVEGVSSRLISKPPKDPVWDPASLEDVKVSDVDKFFTADPESGVKELDLLPRFSDGSAPDYHDYPYARFGLPRESDIRRIVDEHGRRGSRNYIMQQVLQDWKDKQGVEEKVVDVFARKTHEGRDPRVQWI